MVPWQAHLILVDPVDTGRQASLGFGNSNFFSIIGGGVDLSAEAKMREHLESFLEHTFPCRAPVLEHLCSAAGDGRSRENWSFDLLWPDRREELILRRDPEGGLVRTDRSDEFCLLRALEPTPLPSPATRWLDGDGAWFGRPTLIMERLPGRSDYFLLNGDLHLERRLQLAEELCRLLGAVHALDWHVLGLHTLLPDPGEHAAAAELGRWEAVLREDQVEAYPEIDLAIVWLRDRAPSAPERVLVHGDFKPGNVLIDDTSITALLDWELAHLGDPMEDLGWMTQPLRHREQYIPGAWERDEILRTYEAVTRRTVDEARVVWWNTFATFRTAVMQVTGLRSYLDGRSTQPLRPTRKVLGALLEAVEV